MRKYIYLALMCVFTSLILGLSKSYAQESVEPVFDVEYNIRYEVKENAETAVFQSVGIINRQTDVIPTNYTLSINQMAIYDAKAFMDGDELETKLEHKDSTYKVKTTFEQQAIGEGKKTQFDIEYKTKDISSQVGKIWNINIPRVEMSENTKIYNIELLVPKSFGPMIFVSPPPSDTEELENITIFRFDKEQLENVGISASFGNYQLVNFRLKYQLQNPSSFSSYYEIALPPDLKQRQQIIFDQLTPIPAKMFVDDDGNFIARYKLKAKESIEVEFIGSAKIFGKQINPVFGGEFSKIPQKLKATYTKQDTYWEVGSSEIQQIAKSLKDEKSNVALNAKKAYEFTVAKLHYDFDLGTKDTVLRKGARQALLEPAKAACMEFTDLFIAITRAMGIPARELNGYAIATDISNAPLSVNLRGGDYLHAWPEFYDPVYGWVAVDPTWGNTSKVDYFTKLDTNHFVFSVKGVDSEFPAPAGSYKYDEKHKQVEVDFAQDTNQKPDKYNLKLTKLISLNPVKLLSKEHLYRIENTGNVTIYNPNNNDLSILPNGTALIYVESAKSYISYEDFIGTRYTVALPETAPVQVETIFNQVNLQTLIGIGGALVLYMTL